MAWSRPKKLTSKNIITNRRAAEKAVWGDGQMYKWKVSIPESQHFAVYLFSI